LLTKSPAAHERTEILKWGAARLDTRGDKGGRGWLKQNARDNLSSRRSINTSIKNRGGNTKKGGWKPAHERYAPNTEL